MTGNEIGPLRSPPFVDGARPDVVQQLADAATEMRAAAGE